MKKVVIARWLVLCIVCVVLCISLNKDKNKSAENYYKTSAIENISKEQQDESLLYGESVSSEGYTINCWGNSSIQAKQVLDVILHSSIGHYLNDCTIYIIQVHGAPKRTFDCYIPFEYDITYMFDNVQILADSIGDVLKARINIIDQNECFAGASYNLSQGGYGRLTNNKYVALYTEYGDYEINYKNFVFSKSADYRFIEATIQNYYDNLELNRRIVGITGMNFFENITLREKHFKDNEPFKFKVISCLNTVDSSAIVEADFQNRKIYSKEELLISIKEENGHYVVSNISGGDIKDESDSLEDEYVDTNNSMEFANDNGETDNTKQEITEETDSFGTNVYWKIDKDILYLRNSQKSGYEMYDIDDVNNESEPKWIKVEGVQIENKIKPTKIKFGDSNYPSYMKYIEGIEKIDTSLITDMSGMFEGCVALKTLDLSSFDTSNVTDMNSMFIGCNELTRLDLSSFDTSNVTDMNSMFWNCGKLETLDLSGFKTSHVKNMSGMFEGCGKLVLLDLSSFDTSNVIDMSSMFYFCESLAAVDLSSFNTSNVIDMNSMFYYCQSLIELDLSSFNTANVDNMGGMFYSCKSLTTLDISNFVISDSAGTMGMFSECDKLKGTFNN